MSERFEDGSFDCEVGKGPVGDDDLAGLNRHVGFVQYRNNVTLRECVRRGQCL